MRGDAHHRSGSIAHEDEVRSPYGYSLPAYGVNCVYSQRNAAFFHGLYLRLGNGSLAAPGDKIGNLGIFLRHLARKRVLGGQRQIGRPHDRVRARGEYLKGAFPPVHGEIGFNPLGFSYPVFLHGFNGVGPPLHLLELAQQFLGVIAYPQEPLRYFLFLDNRSRTPPLSVNYLFVSEHRPVNRVPVHDGGLSVRQSFAVKSREKPLLPAVIFNVARRDFPAPVVAEPEAHELLFHLRYVVPRPGRGMYGVLYRRVFRGKTEGVPSDGVENVKTPCFFESRDDVSDRVVPDVAHVDSPRRVGEHLEDVVLFPGRVFGDLVGVFFRPEILPFFLDFSGFVFFFHCEGKALFGFRSKVLASAVLF